MLFNRLFSFVCRQAQSLIFHNRLARLLLVITITLFAVITPQIVFASQPVDPATLNPPPPPEVNPVCQAVGGGTRCDISYTQTQGPGGSGLICRTGATSFEVVGFDMRTVNGFRVYDQNGNLIQRHFREDLVGWLASPLNGKSLDFVQAGTIIHDLAVPGDINSGTNHISELWKVSLPHGGTVFMDVGLAIILESDGSLIFEAGQHPLDAYFGHGDASAIQPICDALK